jgi:hypothetical protein
VNEDRQQQERIQTMMTIEIPFVVTLEKFLTSPDFRQGVIDSTCASWGGSGWSVELFPDGTWRTLWNNSIGNRYESGGIILRLPTLEDSDMQEYIDAGAGDEEDFLKEAFECEVQELAQSMREALAE